jgi:hypothetical protein
MAKVSPFLFADYQAGQCKGARAKGLNFLEIMMQRGSPGNLQGSYPHKRGAMVKGPANGVSGSGDSASGMRDRDEEVGT